MQTMHIGDRTCIGRIANLVKSTKKQESTIAKEINQFILVISAVAISLGVRVFLVCVCACFLLLVFFVLFNSSFFF